LNYRCSSHRRRQKVGKLREENVSRAPFTENLCTKRFVQGLTLLFSGFCDGRVKRFRNLLKVKKNHLDKFCSIQAEHLRFWACGG
jgi:hypothetical protein